MNVFEKRDYRQALAEVISEMGVGARSRLAQAARCSPSWLTRVLASEAQITPDQAFAIATFLQMTPLESDYFLLLVDQERASSKALRERIQSKLRSLKAESLKLSAAIQAGPGTASEISAADQLLYYSSWIHSLVHVATMVGSPNPREVADRLRLSMSKTVATLQDLKRLGLVSERGGKWTATGDNIHLNADHDLSRFMHGMWRAKTIQEMQEGDGRGLHYSGVHCLSKADLEKIRDRLKRVILECRKVIEPSSSETMAIFCLDWFEI